MAKPTLSKEAVLPEEHAHPVGAILAAIFQDIVTLENHKLDGEVIVSTKACEICICRYSGPHLTKGDINNLPLSSEQELHLELCAKCRDEYYKAHPLPNKMGVSDRRYIEAIT